MEKSDGVEEVFDIGRYEDDEKEIQKEFSEFSAAANLYSFHQETGFDLDGVEEKEDEDDEERETKRVKWKINGTAIESQYIPGYLFVMTSNNEIHCAKYEQNQYSILFSVSPFHLVTSVNTNVRCLAMKLLYRKREEEAQIKTQYYLYCVASILTSSTGSEELQAVIVDLNLKAHKKHFTVRQPFKLGISAGETASNLAIDIYTRQSLLAGKYTSDFGRYIAVYHRGSNHFSLTKFHSLSLDKHVTQVISMNQLEMHSVAFAQIPMTNDQLETDYRNFIIVAALDGSRIPIFSHAQLPSGTKLDLRFSVASFPDLTDRFAMIPCTIADVDLVTVSERDNNYSFSLTDMPASTLLIDLNMTGNGSLSSLILTNVEEPNDRMLLRYSLLKERKILSIPSDALKSKEVKFYWNYRRLVAIVKDEINDIWTYVMDMNYQFIIENKVTFKHTGDDRLAVTNVEVLSHVESEKEKLSTGDDIIVLGTCKRMVKLTILESTDAREQMYTSVKKHAYQYAIILAKNEASTVDIENFRAETRKKYGDQLEGRNDYNGAISQYILSIPLIEPSYVIRKFLDTNKIVYLIKYLYVLHVFRAAKQDHTVLLLNSFLRLGNNIEDVEYESEIGNTYTNTKRNTQPIASHKERTFQRFKEKLEEEFQIAKELEQIPKFNELKIFLEYIGPIWTRPSADKRNVDTRFQHLYIARKETFMFLIDKMDVLKFDIPTAINVFRETGYRECALELSKRAAEKYPSEFVLHNWYIKILTYDFDNRIGIDERKHTVSIETDPAARCGEALDYLEILPKYEQDFTEWASPYADVERNRGDDLRSVKQLILKFGNKLMSYKPERVTNIAIRLCTHFNYKDKAKTNKVPTLEHLSEYDFISYDEMTEFELIFRPNSLSPTLKFNFYYLTFLEVVTKFHERCVHLAVANKFTDKKLSFRYCPVKMYNDLLEMYLWKWRDWILNTPLNASIEENNAAQEYEKGSKVFTEITNLTYIWTCAPDPAEDNSNRMLQAKKSDYQMTSTANNDDLYETCNLTYLESTCPYYGKRIMDLIKFRDIMTSQPLYDPEHALLLFEEHQFGSGLVQLYQDLKLSYGSVKHYIDLTESKDSLISTMARNLTIKEADFKSKEMAQYFDLQYCYVLNQCSKLGNHDPKIFMEGLLFFRGIIQQEVTANTIQDVEAYNQLFLAKYYYRKLLQAAQNCGVLSALDVLKLKPPSKVTPVTKVVNDNVPVNTLHPIDTYIRTRIFHEQQEIAKQELYISSLKKETERLTKEVDEAELSVPIIKFACPHTYHEDCLKEFSMDFQTSFTCPQCDSEHEKQAKWRYQDSAVVSDDEDEEKEKSLTPRRSISLQSSTKVNNINMDEFSEIMRTFSKGSLRFHDMIALAREKNK